MELSVQYFNLTGDNCFFVLIGGHCKSVVLVRHGYFNMFIAKELRKKGWEGISKRNAKHWNCMTFSLLN